MAPQFMCLLLCNIVPVGLGKKRDFPYMAANPANFQIMFLGMPEEREIIIDISGVALKSSPADKLLGVFLDRKFNFKTHIQSLCKTASQKIKAFFESGYI